MTVEPTSRAPSGGFVGRGQLLAELVVALQSGDSLVVRGPAGIGKSRLVHEALGATELHGRLVEQVVASPSTRAFQLGALSALAAPGDVGPGDVPSVVSWFLGRWRSLGRDGRRPLVWVDDAQQLDGLSAAVLRQALAAGIVQLVVTHRTPEPLPDEVVALSSEGRARTVDVPPLDRASTAELVTHLSSEPVTSDDDAVADLYELTGGYPLYVRNLVEAGLGDGGRPPLRSLDALVGARFIALPPEVRRVAELVATAGELDLRLLADDVDHVATLRHHGLLRGRGDEPLRLEHPLYAAWLVEAMGPLVARAHAELIDRASAEPDVVDDVTLADWHLQAGLALPAALAASATSRSLALSDGPNARRFVEHVDDVRRTLWEGQALVLSGDLDVGLRLLEQARGSGPPQVRVAAANWSARYLGLMRGDHDTAHRSLDEVEDVATDPELEREVLSARLLLWLFGTGATKQALARVPDLLELDLPVSSSSYDLAANGAALIYQLHGYERSREALAKLHRLERLDIAPRHSVARGRVIEGYGLVHAGRPADGAGQIEAHYLVCLDEADAESAALLAGAAGLALAWSGQIEAALTCSERLEPLRGGLDWYRWLALEHLVAAGNRALATGDITNVEVPAVPDLLNTSPADVEPAFAARARTLILQRTRQAEVDPALLASFRRLSHGGKRAWLAALASELLSADSPRPLAELTLDVLQHGDQTGLMAPTADAAQARLEDDLDLLLHAASTYERIGLPVAASRAYADVARDARAGRPRVVDARRGIVRSLRRWDGGPTWWTADISNLPTARQLDVAWRIAGGHSVAEVSDELVLSRRTVENHLYRVGQSLGTSGRDELTTALRPLTRPDDWIPTRRSRSALAV